MNIEDSNVDSFLGLKSTWEPLGLYAPVIKPWLQAIRRLSFLIFGAAAGTSRTTPLPVAPRYS